MTSFQAGSPPHSSLKNFDVYDVRECGLPKFDRKDLRLTENLGRGFSSNVYLVATECRQQLALKCLDPTAIDDADHFVSLAGDIFREAHMLANLDHKNVVHIRGVSIQKPSESFYDGAVAKNEAYGFFFLMDVLEETLMDRINRWSKEKGSFQKTLCFMPPRRLKKINTAKMLDRIEHVATGIAEGMEYLHEQNLVIQDVKPQNIGFDLQTGRVCLFDLGMARHIDELSEAKRFDIGGTPRYTAPELFQGGTPTKESDVYSFGCVLYAICSLEAPFQERKGRKKKTLHDFEATVVAGHRPSLDHIRSHSVRNLISNCWAQNPAVRPSFREIARDRLPAITRPEGVQQVKPFLKMDSAISMTESCTSSFRSEVENSSQLPAEGSLLSCTHQSWPSPEEEVLTC
eukprot:scaffold618_cov130-Cylindrotheca_fusiformis.AAC.27